MTTPAPRLALYRSCLPSAIGMRALLPLAIDIQVTTTLYTRGLPTLCFLPAVGSCIYEAVWCELRRQPFGETGNGHLPSRYLNGAA